AKNNAGMIPISSILAVAAGQPYCRKNREEEHWDYPGFCTDPIAISMSTRRPARSRKATTMARLLSVNVGLPHDIEWKGRTVHTGIWKAPVPGRCRVGRLNLDGDGQGDLGGHGGEQRAVFVYQIESYRYWQEQLKRTDFIHGQFSENFTIEGLPDDTVCIG